MADPPTAAAPFNTLRREIRVTLLRSWRDIAVSSLPDRGDHFVAVIVPIV
jgi:hypothetical protein